jgi:hypothetical protein
MARLGGAVSKMLRLTNPQVSGSSLGQSNNTSLSFFQPKIDKIQTL